jgi:hypothetical protein
MSIKTIQLRIQWLIKLYFNINIIVCIKIQIYKIGKYIWFHAELIII